MLHCLFCYSRASKFQNVHELTLFFSKNFGDLDEDEDPIETCIHYIGFKGINMKVRRNTDCVVEGQCEMLY